MEGPTDPTTAPEPPAQPAPASDAPAPDDATYRFDPRIGRKSAMGVGDNRRKRGRLPLETLACSLGPVVDLSAGGMQVLCSRKYKGELEVNLMDWGISIPLRVRVAWRRKRGFFRYETGFEFVDVPADVARQLTALATTHRRRRSF